VLWLRGGMVALGVLTAGAGASCGARSEAGTPAGPPPPPVHREFRAVWVATVDNIDWPTKPGLPSHRQQTEAIVMLDRFSRLRLNAVILQVRPSCDALYKPGKEPWSEYLTGRQGTPPSPPYDPLQFWIEESHKRGMELHVWFNPYRARHPSMKGPNSADHVSKARPALVKSYGKHLWMDPGDPAVQAHSLAVIRDVVRRYDVDGAHIDDYFYPYKEKDEAGKEIPFPDDASWEKYRAGGGTLERDDWRRENVNQFVKRMYEAIHAEKKWVRFGISPFGIWRPGHPPSVKGFDQHAELYADARKWLLEGWCDYYTPQLYWKISAPAQSYPELLKWWIQQNPKKRHVWPGNFTSRVLQGQFTTEEITEQIRVTRETPGAGGNVHFSAKALMQHQELAAAVGRTYAQPALVPATPWLGGRAPAAPKVAAADGRLTWKAAGNRPWLWVVRLRTGMTWTTDVLPGVANSVAVAGAQEARVSGVDRLGHEGAAAAVALR
jgi:uncharacterized lipoprotein YddW (UPF0748 family)